MHSKKLRMRAGTSVAGRIAAAAPQPVPPQRPGKAVLHLLADLFNAKHATNGSCRQKLPVCGITFRQQLATQKRGFPALPAIQRWRAGWPLAPACAKHSAPKASFFSTLLSCAESADAHARCGMSRFEAEFRL
ncbi:hypothetical protein [Solimonas aquatica]|uniref:hypothetical protein n=1 Tax=Solimonas aquatica TaxID=489703 RepID=UPI001160122C|nr:hypothetical protein [Solimonas aquatica]